jgi:murein DD-endopeptidase MepM/ murein hydrolase activator NlpD
LVPQPPHGADLFVGLPTHGRIFSGFGRPRPGHLHHGIDIAAPTGTPVWTTAAGTVSSVRVRQGYGLTVIVDHGDGRQTLYAHLGAATVHAGEQVAAGAVVGQVGVSGVTTGPHLHFETRTNGVAHDPGLG